MIVRARLLTCAAVALLASGSSFAHAMETGNDAYRLCLGVEGPAGELSPRERLSAELAGVLVGYEALIATSPNICAPLEIDFTQATDLLCKRLAEHPETRHHDWRELFFLALVEAFPCR